MATNDQSELITSTVAVVLNTPISLSSTAIKADQLEAVLRRPLSFLQGPEGPIITSNRDQTEIHLLNNKIDVRESSGDVNQSRNKIPRIATGFLGILGTVEIRSYGVNFILEFNVERPEEWLGGNLINPAIATKFGAPISGNAVDLVLAQPPKILTFRFQAQPANRLNVNFNASEDASALPDEGMLESEIGKQYKALGDFLSQVGLQI